MRNLLPAAFAACVVAFAAGSASAQEVTLKGITAFAEQTFYSRGFEKFIAKVTRLPLTVICTNLQLASIGPRRKNCFRAPRSH